MRVFNTISLLCVSNKFCIDYSKGGTANCKICKKDGLRIGKHVPFKIVHILQYYPSNVRLNRFSELRYHQIL